MQNLEIWKGGGENLPYNSISLRHWVLGNFLAVVHLRVKLQALVACSNRCIGKKEKSHFLDANTVQDASGPQGSSRTEKRH